MEGLWCRSKAVIMLIKGAYPPFMRIYNFNSINT